MRQVLLILMLCVGACAPNGVSQTPDENPVMGAPWHMKKKPSSVAVRTGVVGSTTNLWFAAYKNTVSRIDGNRCQFAPSCSRFAKDAMSRFGVAGVSLAFARLHRTHQHDGFYPYVGQFLSDPLSHYTFYWGRPLPDNFDAFDDPSHAWFQHVRLVE